MSDAVTHVLFLCTHNSARSVLAEGCLAARGAPRFRAWSAGSQPSGRVNPFAIEKLREEGIAVEGLRSKSWDEFARSGAPRIDIVVTVCDSAASETCPVWPGHPLTAHWGVADPSAAQGSDDDKRRAFRRAWDVLSARIARLVALPVERMDRETLAGELRAIGLAQD